MTTVVGKNSDARITLWFRNELIVEAGLDDGGNESITGLWKAGEGGGRGSR
jgi:hypothetical protein